MENRAAECRFLHNPVSEEEFCAVGRLRLDVPFETTSKRECVGHKRGVRWRHGGRLRPEACLKRVWEGGRLKSFGLKPS